MDAISDRLAKVRAEASLSLREFASEVAERVQYSVSHYSVRQYETGKTAVPAVYVQAVCEAFGVDPGWLLLGDARKVGADHAALKRAVQEMVRVVDSLPLHTRTDEGELQRVKEDWEQFAMLQEGRPLRPIILASWDRSSRSGVEPNPKGTSFRSVDRGELEDRKAASRELIGAARPHVTWLHEMIGSVPHVAYVVCRDGIVVYSTGTSDQLLDEWKLLPGYDWSEATMGTNGAGTALVTDQVVAVIGPEHFRRDFRSCTCLAAPIHDRLGKIVGALDLSTSMADGKPEWLAIVAYVAREIEASIARAGAS